MPHTVKRSLTASDFTVQLIFKKLPIECLCIKNILNNIKLFLLPTYLCNDGFCLYILTKKVCQNRLNTEETRILVFH